VDWEALLDAFVSFATTMKSGHTHCSVIGSFWRYGLPQGSLPGRPSKGAPEGDLVL
jgi:hypothetical protein